MNEREDSVEDALLFRDLINMLRPADAIGDGIPLQAGEP